MKRLTLMTLTIFSLFSLTANAASTKGNLTVSPVFGLETVYKLSPEVKKKTRSVVGVNVLYGPKLFSLEVEGTRSEDSETLYDQDLTETEESYAAKLGFRSTLGLGFLSWYLRAGCQGRKSFYETTQSDVTTESESALYLSPYAGTGFSLNLMQNIFASGGITVIFSGRPKGSDREYQSTLSFGVRI